MHPFLIRQNVHYGIYLVEPLGNLRFNRGLLESIKDSVNKWNCFFIHDVDLIPENNFNYYKCDENYPLQYAILLKQFNYFNHVNL